MSVQPSRNDYATVSDSATQLGRIEILLALAKDTRDHWTADDVHEWVRRKSYDYRITDCSHPGSRTAGFCLICTGCGTTLLNLKAERQWEWEGKR